MTLALGIDIGTSGVRAAVLDPDGALIATARTGHESQDPDHIDAEGWWRATQDCLSDLLRRIDDPRAISSVAVDGTSGTMVLTDRDLRPVTRALMYNSGGFDAEAARIARHAPQSHITRGANSALARALRLQSEDAEGRAAHLLHQADYILAKLRGAGGISDENNALKTGHDPVTGWPAWIGETGLNPALLPRALPAGTPVGVMDRATARAFGLSETIMTHAGTTDSIAAFLAAAPLKTGRAVTSLGTTLAVKLLSGRRIDAPESGLYSHRLGDGWLVGGASNTGGGVLKAIFSPEELTRLSARIDPDQPSPLDYYPLLSPGERFPINDPRLAPRLGPRPEDDAAYLHGLLESMARIEARCYDEIVRRGGERPSVIHTAGGGAANDVWTAIRARVLGVPIRPAAQGEASCGAARLAQQA